MEYPSEFSEESYIEWHENKFPDDTPFQEKLEGILENVQNDLDEKFKIIDRLLGNVFRHAKIELKKELSDSVKHSYDFPHQDLEEKNWEKANVIKSEYSIINKLWRKNPKQDISLSVLTTEINDLIRFSVKAPSFYHCDFVCSRLEEWKDFLRDEEKEEFKIIDSIDIDKEAKLASGYYAYHTVFKFTDDISIEVQFYSEITESWRKLSHEFYEAIRSNEDDDRFENEWQKLVALGHLLKLVESDFIAVLKSIQDKGGFT